MGYIQYDHGSKQVFCIDMCQELEKPYSVMVRQGVTKYLKMGKNVAILVNKKGYSAGTVCNECGHIPRCKNCDVAIAVHKNDQGGSRGLCHICKHQYTIDAECSQCGGHDVTMYGLGGQQVVAWCEEQFSMSPLVVDSKTTNSPKKSKQVASELPTTQLIVGTSLLTVPMDGRSPDMIVVLSADMGLNIPDYQAQRNTFIGLYSIIKNHDSAVVLVQSYNTEHKAIHSACALDLPGMKKHEHEYRKMFAYPPYADMCVVLYKHEIEERLFGTVNKLFQELLFLKDTYEMKDLEIYTTPPMIYKMYGKYRYTIILKGTNLRSFMDIIYSKLKLSSRGFKIDREPKSLV